MTEVTDLAARLERLERIEIAKATAARYARACDAKDVAELAATVFTADVTLHIRGADHVGIDAVGAFFRAAFDAEPGTRRHFLTNHVAEITADGSVAIDSYFMFVGVERESVIGWGAYRDIVTVDGSGSGRIREKTIVLDMHTTVGAGWAATAMVSEAR